MDGSLQIRAMSAPEVETLVAWAAAEGWNPGLHDARAFYAADPDGFLGGFIDGELVSGISAVAYGDDFGFIGLYIVRPDQRGRGYGKAVWNAGMARLTGRTVGLDGVPEQQANYRSQGFAQDYGTTRYSGRFPSPNGAPVNPEAPTEGECRAIADFERAFFPAARSGFLDAWLTPPHLIVVHRAGETLSGYGVARTCREGVKIGPLFANDVETARDLVESLASGSDDVIHLDVPDHQTQFIDFLTARGFMPGFRTARMYRGTPPAIQLDGVFAITSLELG